MAKTLNSKSVTFAEQVDKVCPTAISETVIPQGFNGNVEDDFIKWFRRFDLYYSLLGYNKNMKCKLFGLYMKHNAETYYWDLDEQIVKDYESLVSVFTKHFAEKADFFLENKLLNRKQLPTESVHDYACHINELCSKLKIKKQNRMFYFVQGLHEKLKTFVLSKRAKDIEDAIDLAKLYKQIENFNTKKDNTNQIPVTDQCRLKIGVLSPALQKKNVWITQDKKQCFDCGESGHIRKYCSLQDEKVNSSSNCIT